MNKLLTSQHTLNPIGRKIKKKIESQRKAVSGGSSLVTY